MSKRKLDESAVLSPLNPTRMRKDDFTPAHRSSSAVSLLRSPSSPGGGRTFQFFVRGDYTFVLDADPGDTIESVHLKIYRITRIPLTEQRLIYRGKQLQLEQTLSECEIEKNATLFLVGRLRSTRQPSSYQLVHDIVSMIDDILIGGDGTPQHLYWHHPSKTLKSLLLDYLRMTPKETDKTSEHFEIFNEASVAANLVKLYISSHETDKKIGDEAIEQFICFSKNTLSKGTHKYFIPIILDFCWLLKRVVGIEDKLYCLCRSSLASMVVNFKFTEDNMIRFLDIFPFLVELALDLSKALVLSMESSFCFKVSLPELVTDFSKFATATMDAVSQFKSLEALQARPIVQPDVDFSIEIGTLGGMFEVLLSKFDDCFERIESRLPFGRISDADNALSGCSQYLTLLKDLNAISKHHSESEELFWKTMKRRKDALCHLVVAHAKRSEDHNWILEHKEVTNFESRKHLAMLMLPEVKDEFEELHEMLIDRGNLLSESFEYIAHAEAKTLRSGLFMEFKNEEATGPGVLREWFLLVCRAIFDPRNALYVSCPNDPRRFSPNPASNVDPLHLEYFKFSGRIVALLLMHKIQIGMVLDRIFVLLLAGGRVELDDIRDVDPRVHTSCRQILSMDPEAVDQDILGLTFEYEFEELGCRKAVELCPDGKNVPVDSRNRGQYVDSLIQHRFVLPIVKQVDEFRQGFTEIMSCVELKKFFRCLDPEDWDSILYGGGDGICVDDWKAHTKYNGFIETDEQISWFWQVVEGMTEEEKRSLLSFWTSIKFLPVEGFRGLGSHLYIYKTSEPEDHLPTSHTCFYRLCFPVYSSGSVMRVRLGFVTQDHVAFSFGTW